jgi:hypothetical protein
VGNIRDQHLVGAVAGDEQSSSAVQGDAFPPKIPELVSGLREPRMSVGMLTARVAPLPGAVTGVVDPMRAAACVGEKVRTSRTMITTIKTREHHG